MAAGDAHSQDAELLLGRSIYHKGTDASGSRIRAQLALTGQVFSATEFACVNCHGVDGEAGQEGEVSIPAINAPQLLARNSASSVLKVITQGLSNRQQVVSPAMPRYTLSRAQGQALLRYLSILGSAEDPDPGVTDAEVHFASLLPITGKLSARGQALQSTLATCIARVNRQGLIYGRKLVLDVVDYQSSPEQLVAASKRLLLAGRSFALLSGDFPEDNVKFYTFWEQTRTPVIAPLTFNPQPHAADSFFYFLPSWADQARALLDYWLDYRPQARRTLPKLVVVYDEQVNITKLVTSALAQQIQRQHLPKSAISFISLATTLDAGELLQLTNAEAIFFVAEADAIKTFIAQQPELSEKIWLGLLDMLGPNFAKLSRNSLWISPFLENHVGEQDVACAAVDFAVAGLKVAGKHLRQAHFLKALTQLEPFAVKTMPALQFDPYQRVGLRGGFISIWDPKTLTFRQVNDWVMPLENEIKR